MAPCFATALPSESREKKREIEAGEGKMGEKKRKDIRPVSLK